MSDEMTHWERIRATLRDEEIDRVAVSMWRHFFENETSARSLAEAMLTFQNKYNWDFMKVNPRASYHAEGWGLKVRYEGNRSPLVTETPVKEPDDWLKLETLSPENAVLREHLEALEIISKELNGELPFLMTVFTPLSIAADLAPSEEIFLQHLREYPDKVKSALEVITETFTDFSRECFSRGISGLFFATTSWATLDSLTQEEYLELARPFDLRLLQAMPAAEFNILHVCRDNNFLNLLKDYPAQAFNWDINGRDNPSLLQGKDIVDGKIVVGGIRFGNDLVQADEEQVKQEISDLKSEMGNKGWMLGVGCSFAPETPDKNVAAIRESADK